MKILHIQNLYHWANYESALCYTACTVSLGIPNSNTFKIIQSDHAWTYMFPIRLHLRTFFTTKVYVQDKSVW